ncbi:gustatory receptor for sugar taste 64f-like isoform X2 [Vanessa atalanta]|uniref:gustatory receptor for sugar taste 64f-like isoform X2 n=1 Tax=Vanessa atalanta TaxID=42275 RepID=UPI001FCD0A29|nr:gustatory receptor for sugar taste 64f-like isoform X2 [Vanessa atalanta]
MTVAKETFSVTVVQIDPKQIMKPKNYKRKIPFMIPSKTNKVGVSDLKKNKAPATFQKSLRVTLIIGQMFSLLPVEGVCSTSPIDVRFVWWSFKFTYLILSLIGQFFITFMCLYKILHSTSSLNGTTPLIFYGTTCITTTLFLRVALRWPDLIRHIAHVEDQDSYYDRTLTLKCNATCGGVLFLALVEHLLSLLSAYTGAMVCQSEDMTHESFVKHFYPWVFNYLPYSFGLGILTQFLHFQSTFIWNFSDLFVICISYYLTSRLNYVNKQLLNAQGKYLPEVFWRTVREEYCRAAQLVRRVDDVINGVIFISFANNLFFICLQLFNSLEDGIKGNGECSSRVSLIASQVNSASNVPASVLYDVPSPVYCVEVQRFLDQVNGDNIALSGLQFFSVTRGLLLTVAGTIVTYELVMFQFNSQPQSSKISPTSPTLSFYNNTIIPIL